ncbi:DHI2 dehydrogenase, partial [Uria aalge]|nr:DHI2 dehydrogenase [Uria aalge]
MEPGLERWAYGALWAALAGSLALRAARRAPGPGRGLVVPLALLAGLQSLCRACLPLPLGLALAAAAACLLLWWASPRRLLPVAGRAVLVTGEPNLPQKQAHGPVQALGKCGKPQGPQRACSVGKLPGPRLIPPHRDAVRAPRGADAGGWHPWASGAGVRQQLTRSSLAPSIKGLVSVCACPFPNLKPALLGDLGCHGLCLSCVSEAEGCDLPFPCLAAYGASKAALSLLMDTFRSELQPWGIKVSLILPGYYKTGTTCDPAFWNLQKQRLVASLPRELLQAYGEDYVEEINRQFIQFMKVAVEDLSAVVNSITDGLLAANPAVRYYPGQGLGLMYFIHRYLPYFVRDLFLKGFFINPKLPRALRREHHDDAKKA